MFVGDENRYGPWAMRAAAAARQLHPRVAIRLIGVDPSMEKVPPVSAPSFSFCVSLSPLLAFSLSPSLSTSSHLTQEHDCNHACTHTRAHTRQVGQMKQHWRRNGIPAANVLCVQGYVGGSRGVRDNVQV